MTEADFRAQSDLDLTDSGTISYRSPSNIALVKYWGKHGEQLPCNPSVSFTLSKSHTTTTLRFERRESNSGFDFKVLLDGVSTPSFKPKITQFFERVKPYLSFLEMFRFSIETSNSFPHSSGIASSASGMSALACCLLEMERMFSEKTMQQDYFNRKASFLSRLGSGSACRSIEGPLVVWGAHAGIEGSSDLYGTRFPLDTHSIFDNYQDTILLVDKGEKQVSSTVGHGLMNGHPYADKRFEVAGNNLSDLVPVFATGDLERFMSIVESEALQLHAMMMSSRPYFILMKPNTLEIINRVWKFRQETAIPLCFTLDAGANVHLLYPEQYREAAIEFISSELTVFCKNGDHIQDSCGDGAVRL